MNPFTTYLANLKHPHVRNLAWLLACPPLLCGWPDECTLPHPIDLDTPDFWLNHAQVYQTRLLALDQDPSPLLQAIAQRKSTRLGLYAESLLYFWLTDGEPQQYHPYTLIERNIQLFDDQQQTTGELDFLVRNHSNHQVEHWELALKYYLHTPNPHTTPQNICAASPYAWEGLNSNDSLGRKVAHMLNKPFQTTHIANHRIESRKAILKGRLFISTETEDSFPTWVEPLHLHKNGLQGNWYSIPATEKAPKNWILLSRLFWLAPPMQDGSPPQQNNDSTANHGSSGMYLDTHSGKTHMLRFV